MVAGGEPADVAGVADEHGRHHRTDPEHLGEGGLGGDDGVGYATLRLLHLGVEAAQVVEVLVGEGVAGSLDGRGGPHTVEQVLGARSVDFTRDSASHELAQQGMETTGDAVAGSSQVTVALGQEAQHAHVVASGYRGQ